MLTELQAPKTKPRLSDAEIQKYIAALEEASGPQSQSSH